MRSSIVSVRSGQSRTDAGLASKPSELSVTWKALDGNVNRHRLSALLLLIVIGWVLMYPTMWWSWTVAALPLAGFAHWLVTTSRSWLDSMDPNLTELANSTPPAELELTELELSELEMTYVTAFRSQDTGLLMLSQERDTVAMLRTGYAGDVVLATDWTQGRLQTSRALGVPVVPGEYVQLVPGASVESLLATHRAGVDVLTRGLGKPLVADATLEELVGSLRRRRSAFSRRRYRQTARVFISYALGRSLLPVDAQLGLRTGSGVLLMMMAGLAIGLLNSWWWAATERTPRALATGVASALVFGGSVAVLFAGWRTRRRFSPAAA